MLIFCMDFLRLSYIIPFFFLSLENSFANDLPNIASDKEFFIEKIRIKYFIISFS